MANNQKIQEENNQAVSQAVSSVEVFLKENGKTLTTIVTVIVLAVAAIMLLSKFVFKPAKEAAMAAAAPAEAYFQQANFEQALNGDGNVPGLADIISEYGKKAGNGVFFEAAACQLQLKNYSEALNYLKSYKSKDKIMKARALCCMGDAYAGLDNNAAALKSYKAAAAMADNDFAANYLLKAGIAAEDLGNTAEALACYKQIKVKYPNTIEAVDIDKYISRINSAK